MIDIKKLTELRKESQYPDDTLGLFLFQMVLLFKPVNIVETGFFNGYSSLFMAKALRFNNNCGRIITIDNNDKAKKQHEKYVYENGEQIKITLLIMDSNTALFEVTRVLREGLIDLLFIDGDHSYKGCISDWNTYQDLLSKGAIILIHDLTLPGVNKAVKEITSMQGFYDKYEFMHFPIYHNIVVIRKKDYVLKKQEGRPTLNLDIIK